MGCCLCCGKGSVPYPPCPPTIIQMLKNTTPLHKGEIQHLYNRFCLLADAEKDQEVPQHIQKWNFYRGHITLNPLLPPILRSMFGEKSQISFIDFVKYLSIFRANTLKTSEEQKTKNKNKKLNLLFEMYDQNRDGCIKRSDLLLVVHRLFSKLYTSCHITHIVDIIMLEMDPSGSNKILIDEFFDAFAAFDMEEMLVVKFPEYHGRYAEK